ncbi:hypothetical protein GCM10010420_51510 [Streptomyces glaucosporus]|uniref:Uncharacterized protein n=1 Tax=Streptomyces glaucosporus TaxID=284044 RepID=A0ABN3IXD6_9ACTN
MRFAGLRGFWTTWIDFNDEPRGFAEAVQDAIASEHPFCDEFLPPLARQAQDALVLLHAPSFREASVRHMVPWGEEALREPIRITEAHMRYEHSQPHRPSPGARPLRPPPYAVRLACEYRWLRFTVEPGRENDWFFGDLTDAGFAVLDPGRTRIAVLAVSETDQAAVPHSNR